MKTEEKRKQKFGKLICTVVMMYFCGKSHLRLHYFLLIFQRRAVNFKNTLTLPLDCRFILSINSYSFTRKLYAVLFQPRQVLNMNFITLSGSCLTSV